MAWHDPEMLIDTSTPAYYHWAGYLFRLVLDVTHEHALDDDALWPVIQHLDWPAHAPDANRVAARLLSLSPAGGPGGLRLPLLGQTAVAVYDKRNAIEFELGDSAIGEALVAAIPSEDGMDDFCFHLVGMGQAFYEGLAADPAPALALAQRGGYHESFRYVFESACAQLPYAESLAALHSMFEIRRLADTPDPDRSTLIDLGDDLIGLVVRRDRDSLFVVTPIDERTIPWRG